MVFSKRKRERLQNNWKYIKDYVDPDDLIKLLIDQVPFITLIKDKESKQMNLEQIDEYIESIKKK